MITLNQNNMLYSLLEQHKDGSWWYHPGFTFDTPEEVEECFKKYFDDSRPHMVFEHEEPMYQKHSTSTYDLKTFDFGGLIHWPKRLEGTFTRHNYDHHRD